MKYQLNGSVELYFSVTVDADSEEDARTQAKNLARTGNVNFDLPVDEADIFDVEEL